MKGAVHKEHSAFMRGRQKLEGRLACLKYHHKWEMLLGKVGAAGLGRSCRP